MIRRWWLAIVLVAFVGFLASNLLARQGIVRTKDGQTLTGDIDETTDPANVAITIHGVKTSVPRDNVASITYADNVQQEFGVRLAKLAADDVQGRIDLARWAFDIRQYDLARQAALDAQRIDPHNADIAVLLETIQTQQMMATRKPTTVVAPPVASGGDTNAALPKPVYVSDEQVNTIRQFELKPSDKDVRFSFFNNVQARYLASGDVDANQFNNESQVDQVLDIRAKGDARLSRDVHVTTDPPSLLEFRNQVQPRILAGCASAGCHGGASGGDFFLYRNADNVNAWYTNFYILQQYKHKIDNQETIEGKKSVFVPLVDRQHPEASLLVQYGLPANIAKNAHPDVPGWKPIFISDSDAGLKEILGWMGTSLVQVRDDYPFTFALPTGKPSTQPSSRPAP